MRENKLIYLVNEYLALEETISFLRKEKNRIRETTPVPESHNALYEAEHIINTHRTSILSITKTLEENEISKGEWEAAKERHAFYTMEEYIRLVTKNR